MEKNNSLPLKGLALLALFAISCNRSANKEVTAAADTTAVSLPGGLPPIPGMITPQGLMLVKEASLDLSVGDLGSTARNIRRWLEDDGGYYADWTQQREDDQLQLSMTAKVPTDRFEAFKDSVETLGLLENETASATDMTDTYDAALGRQAMAQRRASQYEHVASGKQALTSLDRSGDQQAEAEAATQDLGQMRRHLAMSTVHLRATQPHQAPSFRRHLWDNLGEGWTVAEAVLLYLAPLWPWVLIVLASVFVATRFKAIPKH